MKNRFLKRLIASAGIVIAFIVIFLIHSINKMINRPVLASRMYLSDTDYEEFLAVTEDGIKIQACFYRGVEDAGTVILCHGHGVDMGRMDDMVEFLRVAGYNLLLFDFRAHGRSGGTLSSIGLHEWKDIKAIIKASRELGYLPEGSALAAYGRSMGAATLINGSEHLPDIDAFVLESSFERLRKIAARDARQAMMLPDTFLTDVVFWIIGKATGIDYASNAPEDKLGGIGTRPVFLIHDELDYRADINAFNALKKGLQHAETLSVPDAWHVCAHQKAPALFENRFLDFLYRAGVRGRK